MSLSIINDFYRPFPKQTYFLTYVAGKAQVCLITLMMAAFHFLCMLAHWNYLLTYWETWWNSDSINVYSTENSKCLCIVNVVFLSKMLNLWTSISHNQSNRRHKLIKRLRHLLWKIFHGANLHIPINRHFISICAVGLLCLLWKRVFGCDLTVWLRYSWPSQLI